MGSFSPETQKSAFIRTSETLKSVRLFSLQSKRGKNGRLGINGDEIAEIILGSMDKVMSLLQKQPGPFMASITRANVKIMMTTLSGG